MRTADADVDDDADDDADVDADVDVDADADVDAGAAEMFSNTRTTELADAADRGRDAGALSCTRATAYLCAAWMTRFISLGPGKARLTHNTHTQISTSIHAYMHCNIHAYIIHTYIHTYLSDAPSVSAPTLS